ncbi:hydrogenase maturation protein HypF [Desulfobaculum xiamenense]|uniref:Carbamoyltransferase n=1 Tax=Desulfobaculum xiamenense TaxID=995050 RepID=A0A846QNR3_9BACT|nr:carbamoyltransferase HypF [Desulfobaculum xiamenense]NJB68827.1 hydrogenase maturation protein HypF [Desulfobaculum xiamenense]
MNEHAATIDAESSRIRFTITGAVQGVGFRPFIYRIALDHTLTGNVRNTPEGVVVEIQGTSEQTAAFEHDLHHRLPPLASIVTCERKPLTPREGEEAFEILLSTGGEGHSVLISPDVATCPDCLHDMLDPENPRYLYPFTNCTNCGPRYTITRSIPYDRDKTSMACFPMCEMCRAEYTNPLDRRFHAQPNACPQCGPEVWMTDAAGAERSRGPQAMREAARALAEGRIMAVKGLGGFHLVCDATNAEAVARLRERKNRYGKPLAVMVPDLDTASAVAHVSPAEAKWLSGIERPIVILRRRDDSAALAPGLAPDTSDIGIMLPYTPLHHVLFVHYREFAPDGRIPALVATSGNMSSEPISIGNREALARLGGIADLFLLHNRDILIRCDDSVVRIIDPGDGPAPLFMRRARGFTPRPVFLAEDGPSVFGTGPELKTTLCVTKGNQAFVSQHIGTMENLETFGFYREIAAHLTDILQTSPQAVVRDLHPDYMTSRWADEESGLPVHTLQHHMAHAHAVMAENRHEGRALVLALDGTGYGEDATLWGGEFLLVDNIALTHQRLAHFSPVRLPGGEAAIREPWRIAQAYLHELGITAPQNRPWPWLDAHAPASRMCAVMLERGLNSPVSTSCGRLFDAVAAMLDVSLCVDYEAQAAIRLEAIQAMDESHIYECGLTQRADAADVLDTLALFRQVHNDWQAGVDAGVISRRFHLGLAHALADAAATIAARHGVDTVGLSGGVMHNVTLAESLPRLLAARGLTPLSHRQTSPGDACISLGQADYGMRLLKRS